MLSNVPMDAAVREGLLKSCFPALELEIVAWGWGRGGSRDAVAKSQVR